MNYILMLTTKISSLNVNMIMITVTAGEKGGHSFLN